MTIYSKLALIFLCDFATAESITLDNALEEKFQNWMLQYNKVYSSREEYAAKFQIWKHTDSYIISRNGEVSDYRLGHNVYSDLTLDEFHARFGLGEYFVDRKEDFMPEFMKENEDKDVDIALGRKLESVPTEVNWVEEGAVVGVKDQGDCGSCWAFSAIAATETIKYLTDGELVSLSEQNIMDCDKHLINNSCNGGNMAAAFSYIYQNEGVCSEEDYPYLGDFQECYDSNCTHVSNTDISGFTPIKSKSTEALMSAVAEQVVSVSIDASSEDFKNYESGVFTGECGTRLNHGLVAVGYGTNAESGLDYWLLKNSWGTGWGDEGYVYLYRDGGEGVSGTCGVLLDSDRPNAPL